MNYHPCTEYHAFPKPCNVHPSRSTWVKPVAPASPRTPDSSQSVEDSQATNVINGGGNKAAHSEILMTAPTGLAGSLLQAAEATSEDVAISRREEAKAPNEIVQDGKLVGCVDTKAAAAVLARPVDSPEEAQEDSTETNIRPETGQNVAPAASGPERTVGEGEGEENRQEKRERHDSLHRHSATNVRRYPSESSGVPESASGFNDAVLPIHGTSGARAPADHRGRGTGRPSHNGLDGSILPGTIKSLSAVHNTVGAFTSTASPQQNQGGEATSFANGIQSEESEPSRTRETTRVDRLSSDVQEEVGSSISRDRSSLLPEARERDEGNDNIEGFQERPMCYRATFGNDQLSPPQVSKAEALPATESSPGAAENDGANDALISNTGSATKYEKTLKSTPCSHDLTVDDNHAIENETPVAIASADDADAIDAETTRASAATVLAAGAAPGSPLSLEETESAMAALIANLRPSLERSFSPGESNFAVARDFEAGGNGPNPASSSTTAPPLTAGDEGKSGDYYPDEHVSVSWEMTAMQESADGGGGVPEHKLDGEASEAATGMYEDDFDED